MKNDFLTNKSQLNQIENNENKTVTHKSNTQKKSDKLLQ